MNALRLFPVVSLAVFGTVSTANAKPVDVDFINKSQWTIEEMYLSPTHEDKWGPDQLGEKLIKPGESFKLTGIPENKYDFKLIDEDGDECIVANLKVAQDSTLKITDENLLDCQSDTEDAHDDADDHDHDE
jgi:hypothetical protein